MSNDFVIGLQVIYRDMEGRNTEHPKIVDVICTVVADPDQKSKRPCPLDYWIENPLRG